MRQEQVPHAVAHRLDAQACVRRGRRGRDGDDDGVAAAPERVGQQQRPARGRAQALDEHADRVELLARIGGRPQVAGELAQALARIALGAPELGTQAERELLVARAAARGDGRERAHRRA